MFVIKLSIYCILVVIMNTRLDLIMSVISLFYCISNFELDYVHFHLISFKIPLCWYTGSVV